MNYYKYNVKNQLNTQKKLFICSFLLIFLFLSPLLMQNNVINNDYSRDDADIDLFDTDTKDTFTELSTPESSADTEPDYDLAIKHENAARFNVAEGVVYDFKDNELAFQMENLTFDIPYNWEGDEFSLDTYAVYEKTEFFQNFSLNGDFTGNTYPWKNISNYQWFQGMPEEESEPYVKYEYNSTDEFDQMIFYSGENEIKPDYMGFIASNIAALNRGGEIVEIFDQISDSETEFPIADDFLVDPEYMPVIDLYGSDKDDSDVFAYWLASEDALKTEIDTSLSAFRRGDPSVGFYTDFYIPFEADQVTITFGWAVENINYGYADGFQVKSRVNGQYIDGRVGAYGEDYTDWGTVDSLEYDNSIPETYSHSVEERTYDITNLLGEYGYRTGLHSLDFGCWMQHPVIGSGDVAVYWDYIIINATHFDWYQSGEVSFEYVFEDLNTEINNPEDIADMAMVMYLGELGKPLEEMYRYYIGETEDLIEGNWSDRVTLNVQLPQYYAPAFEVDQFQFMIGLIPKTMRDGMILNPEGKFYKKLSVDSFSLKVNYIIGDFAEIDFQFRVLEGVWFPLTEGSNIFNNIGAPPPSVGLEFRINNPSYATPYPFLRQYSKLTCLKYTEDAAVASVEIDSLENNQCLWNVTYNNTNSVKEIDNGTFTNNLFNQYAFNIENMPAHDGLGANSKDWDIFAVYNPNGDLMGEEYIEKSSSGDNFKQNGTVYNGTWGAPGSLLRGEWSALAYQTNYMRAGSFNHINGDPSIKFYNGTEANYTLNVTNSQDFAGNYNVSIYNHTKNLISDFPAYHTDLSDNNITVKYNVSDHGVGYYYCVALWNDTDSNGQTTRFGWGGDYYELWRRTAAKVFEYEYPDQGVSVSSGEKATFHLSYNYTLYDMGISGASIHAINNNTLTLWGISWPPHVYLGDSLTYTGDGNYTIVLKTAGVPLGNYNVSFRFMKPFYDTKYTYKVWLNITGILGDLEVQYISGGFNISEQVYFNPNNLPIVNNTDDYILQFKLVNASSPTTVIRDAYVTANFNGTETVMIAIEEYALSHQEEDKGIYNLTIDATYLNTTDQINQFNYTLSISFSAPEFKPYFQNATVSIAPIPLYIDVQPIQDAYEGENIYLEAGLFIDQNGDLSACDFGLVQWSIYNATYQFGGITERIFSNFYTDTVNLDIENYLSPGNYYFVFNASGVNVETTISAQIYIEIFAKNSTKITIIAEEVRIGGTFGISAKLTDIYNNPLVGEDVNLIMNYSTPFEVIKTTNIDGKVSYELFIDEKYAGKNFSLIAEYEGSIYNLNCSKYFETIILGKIEVEINFIDTPIYVQVGYGATFKMNMTIGGELTDNILLYIYGFYDFQTALGGDNERFLIKELTTDKNGSTTYTIDEIADGYKNLTIFYEYLGGPQIEIALENKTIPIYSKWLTGFDMVNLPSIIRNGQTLIFDLTLYSENITFTESYAGLPVIFTFDYGTFTQEFTYFLDSNAQVVFNYKITETKNLNLDITIEFEGTTKIGSKIQSLSTIDILDKKSTSITFSSISEGQLFTGVYFYSADVIDQDSQPIQNLNITFNVYDDSDSLVYSTIGRTNEIGFVSVTLEFLEPGDYYIVAEFNSQSIYSSRTSDPIKIHVVTYGTLFIEWLPYIALGIAIALLSGFAYNKAVVIPRRNRRMEALKLIHQRFSDVENIQYILILTRDGLSLFSRSFTPVPIDGNLVSGFLSAISSFGQEIGKNVESKSPKKDGSSEKGLEQLSFQQFKIVVNDAALVRTAVLLLKDASPALQDKIKRFNLRFQEKYMDILENFSGQVPDSGPILELIEQFLEVDLLYQHNLNLAQISDYLKTADKKSMERLIITEALKPEFGNHFFVREMMDHLRQLEKKDIMTFEGINNLRKAGIAFAINPRTQQLIDQFKPIIDRLSDDAKKIITRVMEGETSESKLRKIKSIEKFDDAAYVLIEMGMLEEGAGFYKLTSNGEAVYTILKLMKF